MQDISSRMDAVCRRFEELSMRLNQPDTAADPALFRKLMREYHDAEPVVQAYREWQTAQDHLEQAKYLIGDVNQDGRVDVTDAVLLSKAVNGSVTVSDAQRETMDCDGDGDITANDVTTLMRFLVHLETELPPKQ